MAQEETPIKITTPAIDKLIEDIAKIKSDATIQHTRDPIWDQVRDAFIEIKKIINK